VKTACLDEIYFHGRPTLVGVEPASMTVILTTRVDRLSRRAWLAALRRFKSLDFAVSDAGTVLRSAVARLGAVRRRAGATPLEAGLDVFHTAKEARRVLKILWNRVRKDWKAAEAALEVFRPDGRLNDRTWAAARIAEALPALSGDAFTTLRGLLGKPDSLTFLDRLGRRLDDLGLDPDLLEALTRLWRLRRRDDDDEGRNAKARLVQQAVCWKLAPDGWAEDYRRAAAVLDDPGRASGAVECVNGVLRMHQSRHRTLNQKTLDLKRLYGNTRKFRGGRRRGRCPFEILGLDLPSYDLATILQEHAAAAHS
jgi:hypothetical protein